ncbi:MAG: hypothetical protein IBX50_08580 [Marinospirillum sp.]|uniref:hypothetical protein n=1 Tax=Marinospirillum sp. TaxID=2183934 RepID=UPI0019FA52B3|nr:hypothetical protein [Marinospirillum sp.]MBE0506762.1 hypothetical protein [Marinospirillum sp.]
MKTIRIKDFSVVHNDAGQSLLACDRFLLIECRSGAEPLEAVLSIEDDMEITVDVPPERMPSNMQKRFPKGIRYTFSSHKDVISPDKDRLLLYWRSAHYDYTVPLSVRFGLRHAV